MLIDECKLCKNHILFQHGYVICNYWKMKEQRVTGKKGDNCIYIVECPSENDPKRR